MSFEAQRVYLTSKVKLMSVGIPFKLPGITFKKPENAPYGEFHIMGTKPIVIAGEGPGKVRLRYVGMIQLDIYLPETSGTKAATMAMDAFTKAFQFRQGRDTAGCTYKFKAAQPFDPATKNGWTVFTVRVPFTRDEVTTVQIGIDA